VIGGRFGSLTVRRISIVWGLLRTFPNPVTVILLNDPNGQASHIHGDVYRTGAVPLLGLIRPTIEMLQPPTGENQARLVMVTFC